MEHNAHPHAPVMADAVIDWLDIDPDGTYVDCTAGAGGHSIRIAERLARGRLVALDRDPLAVELATQRLVAFPNATVVHSNYSRLGDVLGEMGIDHVDGILIDAGISSMQLDDPQRGFSFQVDGPLDMRMDTSAGPTAAEFIDSVTEPELARILKDYGDVGPARRIASAIVRRRGMGRLNSTNDLRDAVAEALDFVTGMPEETRTVFQALRMALNEELDSLKKALERAIDLLAPGGRLVAISFHSGEDRVVKNVLRDASRTRKQLLPDGRVHATLPPKIRILTPKPVQPGSTEVRNNPRAHSARLRAAERLESTS